MHTLITFLGRVPKSETGYRKTRYRFPDGEESADTAFFGWALGRRLQPDKIVILGTAGSMWDHLLEIAELRGVSEQDHMALLEAVEQKNVEQVLLDRISSSLLDSLGFPVVMSIIAYGRDRTEQIALLQAMAGHVPHGSRVSIDVTHGFRHLPMLALMSALHLRVAREARIDGIYYGAYNHDTGDAPVYELSGLLEIADWVDALHTFDKDGDYGIFAPLLERDGLPSRQVDHLQRAAFYERTFNVADAGRSLQNFAPVLDAGLPGIGRLFSSQLGRRTGWHKSQKLFNRQRELARFYLRQGDYPRAAIFAYEAFVTRLIDVRRDEREHDYDDRDTAKKAFMSGMRGDAALKKDFQRLDRLRNALAHGNPSKDRKIAGIAGDPERLPAELDRLLSVLLK